MSNNRRKVRGLAAGSVLATVLLLIPAAEAASPEGPTTATTAASARADARRAEVAELMDHYRGVTRSLELSQKNAKEACERSASKYDRLTTQLAITKDRHGDPMYSHYGPRAYAGSPNYVGPSYASSFMRSEAVTTTNSEARQYYRGAYSHPGLHATGDTRLGVGATHSYFQSGMMMSPGSQAPSGTRAMSNNH